MANYIYHASANLFVDGIDESDFYDTPIAEECGYIENANPETNEAMLSALRKTFEDAGFEILTDTAKFEVLTDSLPDECAFAVKTGDKQTLLERQCRYLKTKFKTFKAAASNMTIKDFVTADDTLYTLRKSLFDSYGDKIYLDCGTGPGLYTLLYFIRHMTPDTTYYFENACVVLHD